MVNSMELSQGKVSLSSRRKKSLYSWRLSAGDWKLKNGKKVLGIQRT